MIDAIQSGFALLGALPPLAPIAVLLMIYNLLPPAPGEQDVWATLPAKS